MHSSVGETSSIPQCFHRLDVASPSTLRVSGEFLVHPLGCQRWSSEGYSPEKALDGSWTPSSRKIPRLASSEIGSWRPLASAIPERSQDSIARRRVNEGMPSDCCHTGSSTAKGERDGSLSLADGTLSFGAHGCQRPDPSEKEVCSAIFCAGFRHSFHSYRQSLH